MQHLRPLSLQVGAGIGGGGAGLLMLYFLPIEALNSQLPVELQQLSTLVDAIRNNWEQLNNNNGNGRGQIRNT